VFTGNLVLVNRYEGKKKPDERSKQTQENNIKMVPKETDWEGVN
jgi:hypothetical protein